MADRSCAACGAVIPRQTRGRPRKYCMACRAPRVRPSMRKLRPCEECECVVLMSSVQRWCSAQCAATWRRRQRSTRRNRPCDACGTTASMTRVQRYCSPECGAIAASRRRTAAVPTYYTCQGCGDEVPRPPTRGQAPKWCESCRRDRRRIEIPPSVRQAVYERDGWICQICLDPVDPSLPPGSMWRPSLDHIVCRSWTDEPDNSPQNLRLAHKWCNSVRSDERAYTDADIGRSHGSARTCTEAV